MAAVIARRGTARTRSYSLYGSVYVCICIVEEREREIGSQGKSGSGALMR